MSSSGRGGRRGDWRHGSARPGWRTSPSGPGCPRPRCRWCCPTAPAPARPRVSGAGGGRRARLPTRPDGQPARPAANPPGRGADGRGQPVPRRAGRALHEAADRGLDVVLGAAPAPTSAGPPRRWSTSAARPWSCSAHDVGRRPDRPRRRSARRWRSAGPAPPGSPGCSPPTTRGSRRPSTTSRRWGTERSRSSTGRAGASPGPPPGLPRGDGAARPRRGR